MDYKKLINEHTSMVLSLIDSRLYFVHEGGEQICFHDDERYDLFFIRLNEYLNVKFDSPIDGKKTTLFTLMIDACKPFRRNKNFNDFLKAAEKAQDFFFKTRYYKYYLSPYPIKIDTTLAQLIEFQGNYAKHSAYHLTNMERVLKNIFKANKIKNFENEDYSEHLEYFKEAVLEDRLDFNSTLMLQILGEYFLSYWKLIHTKNKRIELIINKFLESNDWTDLWKLKKPTNLSKMEEFYWDIKTISSFRKERISNFIPQTNKYLIEKKTFPRRRLNKSGT